MIPHKHLQALSVACSPAIIGSFFGASTLYPSSLPWSICEVYLYKSSDIKCMRYMRVQVNRDQNNHERCIPHMPNRSSVQSASIFSGSLGIYFQFVNFSYLIFHGKLQLRIKRLLHLAGQQIIFLGLQITAKTLNWKHLQSSGCQSHFPISATQNSVSRTKSHRISSQTCTPVCICTADVLNV